MIFTVNFKSMLAALVLACCLLFTSLHAQPIPSFQTIKSEHQGELALYLQKSEHLTIDLKHDSVRIKSNNYSEMLHLSDNSTMYAEKSIYASKFVAVDNIEAKTLSRTPKGKMETVKVTHFNTQNDMGGSIFYDDSKRISFVFPSIKAGATTILQYHETIKEPRFLNGYFFADHLSVLTSTYKVTVDDNIKIRYQLFGLETDQIKFSEERHGKKTTYTWTAKNLKGFQSENGSPNIRYYAPHIIIYIDEIVVQGKTQTNLSNVPALYQFFHQFVKNLNVKQDTSLQKVVDSLVFGINDDAAKTKKIFYWVQDHIRYIAFEDGYGGFIPREASSVFQKRYGDCKDMASILTYMLRYANIEAHLTWIGSRHIPYTFDQNPAPSAANHMIATAKVNGKYVYLDATGIYTPYGLPTDMIQGKQCLMAVDDHTFIQATVPEINQEKNQRYDSICIQIQGKTIHGNGKVLLNGYSKLDLVPPLIAKTTEKEKEILVGYLEKGNNKFFLENYEMSGIANRDEVLAIHYNFKVEDYAKTIQNEIYVNLNLDKLLQHADLDITTRQLPVERDYKYTDKFVVNLTIPAGYKVNYLPQNASFHNEYFGFTISYRIQNNTILLTRNLYINALLVEKPSFEAWNQMITALNKAYKEVVVLAK
jgi:hypothetical protein